MSKGMPIKEALAQWEKETGEKPGTAKKVVMVGKLPMIEKMDASLSVLESCEQLSLSTNRIEKVANLNSMKKLKILSLGRNAMKSLAGIEVVADTLVELWASYNFIDKVKGITSLKKLKVLYLAHNRISDMGEVAKLSVVSTLEDLLLIGNPVEENSPDEATWRNDVKKKLPKLKKLDGLVLAGGDDEDV